MIVEGNRPYLTLKEASEKLGIHPNTLRNWERKGLVRLARLPGGRNRRVPVYEVERLEREMEDGWPEESASSAKAGPADTCSWLEEAMAQEQPTDQSARVIETERVRIELPSEDPAVIAEGRAMADRIKARLADLDLGTLEVAMQSLRGRSWSS